MWGEVRISVRDDFGWDTEPGEEMLEVEECHSFPSDCHAAGDKDGSSGASLIYDCEYGIVFIHFWQLGDEIQGNNIEWVHQGVT